MIIHIRHILRKLSHFLLFITLLLISSTGFSQNGSLTKKLNAYFQEVKKRSPAPGFSVVVVRGKDVIFENGYGVESIQTKKPMTSQSVSAIGSLTKSFTSLAIMQLVEAGKVSLDEPVTTYIPEFRTANIHRSNKITVRMLLNNSSGLYGGVSQKWRDPDESLERLLQSLEAFYLKKEPGNSYEYSNTAFSLAGLMIKRVSGLAYPEYIRQNILKPLAMERSSTNPEDFERLNVIKGHNRGIGRGIPATTGFDSYEMIPAGSMFYSTAEDLGHYLITLLNSGNFKGKSLISSQSIDEMWQPQISFPGVSKERGGDGRDFYYGLGWMISEVEGRTLIHHGGSTGTMSSMTVLYPEKQMAVSMLFNVDYNFIDPYQFPSEFSEINNLFHLLEGEALTDFGIPIISDPTLNNYKLPHSLTNRYLGIYRFNGRGDSRNLHGSSFIISQKKEGELIGEIVRGNQLLSDFELDFTNEAVAFSRNIGISQKIRFKLQPDGEVNGLYFGGSEFRKVSEDFFNQYQWVNTKDKKVGFFLSKEWKISVHPKHLEARNINDSQSMIYISKTYSNIQSMSEVFLRIFPENKIEHQGKEFAEIRSPQVWQSLSISSVHNEKKLQHFILREEASGFLIILTTPFGKLTKELQGTLDMILDSFTQKKIAPTSSPFQSQPE